jgi:hypothetical protein
MCCPRIANPMPDRIKPQTIKPTRNRPTLEFLPNAFCNPITCKSRLVRPLALTGCSDENARDQFAAGSRSNGASETSSRLHRLRTLQQGRPLALDLPAP